MFLKVLINYINMKPSSLADFLCWKCSQRQHFFITENGDLTYSVSRSVSFQDHTSSGAPGSGRDANAYSAEIQQFEILRANACIKPALDINGVQTLKKYYCQLHFLKNRFQVKEGYFNFTW